MPQQPPRHKTGSLRDPRDPPGDRSSLDKPPDISEMETGYLVLPEPLQRTQVSREEQLTAHQTFGDHLRTQQRVLMRQAADCQRQLFAEHLADRRAQMQLQIDNLWAMWNELERQLRAHSQAMRELCKPHLHA